MRFLIYISLLFTTFSFGFGQSKSGEVFVCNDFENNQGVQIKWISSKVYFPNGLDIFRKEGTQDWVKINDARINIIKGYKDIKFTEKQEGLFDFLTKATYAEFQENFVKAFILIEGIYSPEFANVMGITFYDLNAKKGSSYSYKVVGFNGAVSEEVGISKSITVADYTKPNPPQEVVIKRNKTSVEFTWKPALYDYYGIDIYRKSKGEEFVKITKDPFALQQYKKKNGEAYFRDIFYINDSLDPNMGYEYKLQAIDYFGQKSEFTAVFEAPSQDFDPPVAPTDLTFQTESAKLKIDFAWKQSTMDDVAGFHLYESKDYKGEYSRINSNLIPKNELNFSKTVKDAGYYYYYLTSVDLAGNESPSAKVMVEVRDVIPPSKPKNLTTEASSGKILLNWSANSESDLQGYFVQRSLTESVDANVSYININKEPITNTTWEEVLPKNIKNKFTYRVVAVDTSLNRSDPSNIATSQMPDVVAPRTPQIKTVTYNENVEVTWIPNADVDLEGYNLYQKLANDSSEFTQINFKLIPRTVNVFKLRDLEIGKNYELMLVAIDSTGNISDTSATYPVFIAPRVEAHKLMVTGQKLNKNKKSLVLKWESDIDAPNLKGYVIYQADEKNVMKPITGLSKVSEYKTKLEIGKTKFQIRAYEKTGQVVLSEVMEFELIKENQ